MSNLTKFLYGMAEGISEQYESLEAKGDECMEGLALRDYYTQIVAVAENTDDGGRVDWSALEDRIGVDLEPEPERVPGGPAIVGGLLRLPGYLDGGDYRWFDLSRVEEALGDDLNGPGVPQGPAPVYVVHIPERMDGIYVFADHGAAVAFSDALTVGDPTMSCKLDDPPVNVGAGAEDLIAIERAAQVEDLGHVAVAEDIRGHMVPLTTILVRLASIEGTQQARGLIGHWIEVDKEREVSEDAAPFTIVSADSVEPGDWIALDNDGKPDTEPRKVASARQGGTTVYVEFNDDEPGAGFAYDERVWLRHGVPQGCTGAVAEGPGGGQSIAHDAATCPVHEGGEPAVKDDGRCPGCGSDNIVTQTPTDDRPPWACLACDSEFEEPDTTPKTPQPIEPAYTVIGIYHDNEQGYATSVFTFNGVSAAETLAQEACREDNKAEDDEDLLRIIGVIEGEHNLLGGD